MGAGKTSAARAAAAAIGARAVDSDHVLEERLGGTIEAYFASHGERAFRAAEEDAVGELLENPPSPVLSLGGGAIGSERIRSLLRRHTVVLLDVDEETAWRRAGGKRPLARDRTRFAALLDERAPLYDAVADAVLLDSSRDVVRRAVPALKALASAPAGTKLLWATAASGEYPVYVGDGLVGSGFRALEGDAHVVTDDTVGALYGDAVPARSRTAIRPGETAKNLRTAGEVLEALAEAGLDHDGHVIALGGGVVGDLAGFCAAVYQRGVRVVQVPTTLVAQVDSAYGGKTGVDLPQGKNYAGVYHQPAAVLADPRALATLPREELAAGYAEVVKTALIAGGRLWARVRRGGDVDDETILGCIQTKLAVVAEDERDSGRRQVLNLGHTVAHAIESATGYSRYRHGEAVALGLLCALRLSDRSQLRDEVRGLMADHGLPTRLDGLSPDDVLPFLERDKKRTTGDRVPFVLLEAPGEVTPGHELDPASVRAALEELR